jgi:hypothetical protein
LKHPNKKFILNDNNKDFIIVFNLVKNQDIEAIKNRQLGIKTTINNDKDVLIKCLKNFKKVKTKMFINTSILINFIIFPELEIIKNVNFKTLQTAI